ncbi:DUF4097 family beta strand repeat-containing protein [Piscibacillus sp. B03]|uniref:DUF4097 family beta strand repeat-containing protein n=1 Tax=Piscibacillus sp. B03 TaxID=3457430 RepID=UPI003FCE499E
MSEERNKILKLLEEGHLTSEEAEKLLDALEKGQKPKQSESQSSYDDEQDSFKEFKNEFKSFKDGFLSFIDDTIQRIKEGPFEFTFNHVNVKRRFNFSSEGLTQLDLDLVNGSVEFIPTDNSELLIEVNGKVFKENDQSKAEKIFDDSLSAGVTNDTLHIKQDEKNVSAELIIHLPKKAYEQAYVKTINGSVKARELNVNLARVSSINGSIRLDDYQGDSVYVETRHGSIRLNQAKLSQAKLETTTGSIYYDGDVEYLDADVTTGSLRSFLRNSNVKKANLKTTTGSCQLYLPNDIKVKGFANTSVGSVDVNLPNVVVQKVDDQIVKKTVKFYNTTENDPYLDVDVEAKTGSIKINSFS